MRTRAGRGLGIEVAERGEGEPVLLLHGFAGSSGAWGEAALAGLSRSRRVLAPDLPGHGASDDPDGPWRVRLGAVLDDLERVLDAAGVTACPWIGYSMGGRIALAASLLRPARVTRLVLESASPGLAARDERRARRNADEALAVRIEGEGLEAWMEAWERRPLFAGRRSLPAAVLEPFLALRRDNRPRSLASWLRGFGLGRQPSWWARLGEVRAPTLLLTGAEDAKFCGVARAMRSRLPEAEHGVVPGAGHTVHLEAPDAWLDAVEGFLAGGA